MSPMPMPNTTACVAMKAPKLRVIPDKHWPSAHSTAPTISGTLYPNLRVRKFAKGPCSTAIAAERPPTNAYCSCVAP